jgi:hypothetical protein
MQGETKGNEGTDGTYRNALSAKLVKKHRRLCSMGLLLARASTFAWRQRAA